MTSGHVEQSLHLEASLLSAGPLPAFTEGRSWRALPHVEHGRRLRLSSTTSACLPLPYHCSRYRGYSAPLPLHRHPPPPLPSRFFLSPAKWMGTLRHKPPPQPLPSPTTPARSEYSEEGAPGEPRATVPPLEKVPFDPPSPTIRLSCSERRAAVGVWHADPPSSFADRQPDRFVQRRRRRSSLSAGTSPAGCRSKGGHRFGDRTTLSRSAAFELQGPRYDS
jgi:hypothetical protein